MRCFGNCLLEIGVIVDALEVKGKVILLPY